MYAIVRTSGGSIHVYSEPGHGTSFKLYFPRVAADVDPAPPATPATVQGGDGETILLVEDESAVRVCAVRAPIAAGYRVLEAGSGTQALELAAARERQIDLLGTDIVMPRLRGHQLAEQQEAVRPVLGVLHVSGVTENSVIHHGVPDEGAACLENPFSSGELAAAVRAALDRPA